MADIKLPLSEPITTNNGDVKELTLRPPRARLFRQFGAPFTMQSSQSTDGSTSDTMVIHDKAMFEFAADMTGVDPESLDLLAAKDYMALRMTIVRMLIGATGKDPS